MKHSNKKGFTIVELVIVIAVIAILAAVLIPTFSSIVKKANASNDNQLVRSLNVAVAASSKKPANMTEALDLAKDAGIDLAKIVKTKAADTKVLWDSENNLFCFLKGDDENTAEITYNGEAPATKPADIAYWIVSEGISNRFSTYYIGTNNNIGTITKGFDVGLSKVQNVTYERTTGDAQTVVIRTGSGELTVNAPKDTVYHYGNADEVEVIAVANSSFHTFGTIAKAVVKEGRFVAENTATIAAVVVLPATGNTSAKVTVEVSASATVLNAVVDTTVAVNLTANIPMTEAELVKEENGEKVVTLPSEVLTAIETVKQAVATDAEKPAESEITVHNHTWGEVKTVNAQENAPGYTYQDCTTCGERKILSVIPMINTATITPTTNLVYVEIGTAKELEAFRVAYNQGNYNNNVTVKLTADIDLTGMQWVPIGTFEHPFYGTFDGNGKTISYLIKKTGGGLYYKNTSTGFGEVFGLFGIVGGGDVVVKNLTLSNVDIDLTATDPVGVNVGALIGYAPANYNFNKVLGVTDNTFGDHDITIEKVAVTSGSIIASRQVGAIVGKVYSSGKVTIKDCFVGDNSANKTDDQRKTVTVASDDTYSGMLFGYLCPFDQSGKPVIEITNNTIYMATASSVTAGANNIYLSTSTITAESIGSLADIGVINGVNTSNHSIGSLGNLAVYADNVKVTGNTVNK